MQKNYINYSESYSSLPLSHNACKYRTTYVSLTTGKLDEFQCDEEAQNASDHCLFHDPVYPALSEQEMRDTLLYKIKKWFKEEKHKRKPLKIIGYNIPELTLSGYDFTEDVYFSKSNFRGPVTFSNITFRGLNLSNVIFSGAYFYNVHFLTLAIFVSVTSFQKLEFRGCNFRKVARFREADINEIEVVQVTFGYSSDGFVDTSGECDFQFARIKRAFFRNVKFLAIAIFGHTEFGEATFANGTEFVNQADFSNSRFLAIGNFLDVKFNSLTNFHDVIFLDQEKILFNVDSLSNVSFMGSDIMKVRFDERVIWGENGSNKFIIRDERNLKECVYPLFVWEKIPEDKQQVHKLRQYMASSLGLAWVNQDTSIEKKDKNTITITRPKINREASLTLQRNLVLLQMDNNRLAFALKRRNDQTSVYAYSGMRLNAVLAGYRYLRENYEYRLRYEEASEFFIREMELKRTYWENYSGGLYSIEEKHRLKKLSLLGTYHLLSKYGESYRRPTLFAAIIVSLSTMFLYFTNVDSALKHPINVHILEDAFKKSVLSFFPFSAPTDWPAIFSKLLGGLTLGLLFIALRRKFERRFRH